MANIKKILKRTALGIAVLAGLGLASLFALAHYDHKVKEESAVAASFTSSGGFYKPGTLGDSANRLTKKINIDVPVVLIEHHDIDGYAKDFVDDPRAKIITARIRNYARADEKTRGEREKARSIEIYAFVPESSSMQSMGVCPIFLTEHFEKQPVDQQMPTVFHEMTHCQDFHLRRTQSAHRAVIWKRVLDLVPVDRQVDRMRAIDIVFAESLPTANLRALSFLPGEVGRYAQSGFAFELKMAMRNSDANESPEVAKVMTRICAKAGDCPLHLDALEDKLTTDPRYMDALKSDIERFYLILKKNA